MTPSSLIVIKPLEWPFKLQKWAFRLRALKTQSLRALGSLRSRLSEELQGHSSRTYPSGPDPSEPLHPGPDSDPILT